jgi:hypothetical protein
MHCQTSAKGCAPMPESAVKASTVKNKSGGGGRRRRRASRKLRRRPVRKARGGTKSQMTPRRTKSRGVRRVRSAPSGRRSTRKMPSFKRHAAVVRGLRGSRRQTVHNLARTLRAAREMGLGRTRAYKDAQGALADKRRRTYATGRRLLGLPV